MLTPTRQRIFWLGGASLVLFTLVYTLHSYSPTQFHTDLQPSPEGHLSTSFSTKDLTLSDAECDNHFPGLYREIESSVARGNIGPIKPVGRSGYITARIYNDEFYVVAQGKNVWHRHGAILHAINQALVTSPEPLPNVLLPLLLNDHPSGNMISLARSPSPKEVNNTFLMPDYAFWSWPEPKIGAWTEARSKISSVDSKFPFSKKEDIAIWRGTVHFNADGRGKLVQATKGKIWADVQELKWGKNDIAIEDFCKYKFLLYSEGVTYSGRLAYFTQCRSVIITTPFTWFQHYTHLFRPHGPNQNVVFVKPDWSDLESTVQNLLAHPDQAEKIADNLVKTFRDLYLTPAAVNCYWRKLIRGYAKVTMGGIENEVVEGKNRGIRWESFTLMGKMDWEKVA